MQKIRRIVALLSAALIIGLIVATIVCAVTGSEYFFGMFFLMLVVPVVLWVFMWFSRVVNGEPGDYPEDEALKRGTEPEESGSEKIGEDKV